MTSKKLRKAIWLVLAASMAVSGGAFAKGPGSGGGGGGGGETAGNNLSFPVIFSDGVVPGTYVTVLKAFAPIEGDPTLPTVCAQESNTTVPVPTNILCYYGRESLGISEETGVREFTGDPKLWWLQERVQNKWQAHDPIHPLGAEPVVVTALDWGDLLESGAITTRMIRTEMTLFKSVDAADAVYGDEIATLSGGTCDVTIPDNCFAAFKMSGAVPGTDQSINEIQGNDFGPGGTVNPGTTTVVDPISIKGYHATVYSGCARLIVQKLTADPAVLNWNSDTGRWVGDAAAPILELASYAGTYTPEVNAGGNLIYGYNWNAKTVATGRYRLTFVLDGAGRCPYPLNTLFDETTTVINTGEVAQGVVLSRDDLMTLGGSGAEGGVTYVDINMSAKGGGKPR